MKSISAAGRLKRYVPVLAYHSISDSRSDGLAISTAEFETQLQALRASGFESASLEELLSELDIDRASSPAAPPGRRIVFTFDDGYRDNFEQALPLLKKYGYTATFFVVTDMVGADNLLHFDTDKPARGLGSASAFAVMNWGEIEALQAAGMQIGSHTCTHTELTSSLSDEAIATEIVRSRDQLESRLNRKADLFCYPRGTLDPRAYDILDRAGYRGAVVTPGVRDKITETRYTLKRVGVYRSSLRKFQFKLSPQFFRLRILRGILGI